MIKENKAMNNLKDSKKITNLRDLTENKRKEKKNGSEKLKKNIDFINHILLERNISFIKTIFFEKNNNKEKINEFNQMYASYLDNSYKDILLIIKEFPGFNLFNYINPDFSFQNNDEKRKAIYARNNIFLNILIESHLEQNQILFSDLNFLRSHIDTFKNMLCERDNSIQIEIDVDVFFLSIFGYKDKTRSIILKFYDYFKNFLKEFSDKDSQAKIIFENLDIICEKEFDHLSLEELIILRKILNNCVKRRFMRGLEYLSLDEKFCCCLTEGRIWMNLMKYFSPRTSFNFWKNKLEPVISSLNRLNYRPTITEEYNKILNHVKDNGEIEEIEKIKNLEFVLNLQEFLKVAFKSNKKDLAMYACENVEEKLLTPEIFELCLMHDEDIAIFVQLKAIDNDNVKDYYMKVALIKKYFRLACILSRFTVCKNFLHYQEFKDDERYEIVMNKFQIEEKKKFHLHLNKDEHEDLEVNKIINEENIIKESEIKREEININEVIDKKMNDDPITDEVIKLKSRAGVITQTSNESPKEKKKIYSSVVSKIKSLFNTEVKTSNNIEIELKNQDNKESELSEKDRKNKHLPTFNTSLNKNSIQASNENSQIEFLKSSSLYCEKITNIEKKDNSFKKMSKFHQENQGNPVSPLSEEEKIKRDKISNDWLKELDFEGLKNISINVQLVLIDHLHWGQFTYSCLCLLSSIPERFLILKNTEKICKSFFIFIRDEDAISKCEYPILVCVLAAEFLNKLGKTHITYADICHSVARSLLEIAECIQSSMKDEEMLNYYLREQLDHNKRSALEIIAENRFYDLLKNENVASIVGRLWYGGETDLTTYRLNRVSKILNSNIKHEHYEAVISTEKNHRYYFQFYRYAKNCSYRYLINSISTALTTIFYQYIIYFYVSLSTTGILPETDPSFSRINLFANMIVFTIILNQIMHLIFTRKTNRAIKYDIFIFLDFIMFLAVLSNFTRWPMSLYNEADDNRRFIDSIIYSIIIVCAWMRVIKILTTTRTYGPFLRTMYLTLSTVFNFIIILFCFTSLFAQVFTILFKDSNDDFDTFSNSWMTLFAANFGAFSYEDYYRMKIFGYSLLILYTTVSNVMILNLIIAIINDLFQLYEHEADAENRAVLVLTYESIKWDDEYGLLVLLPAPFNIISVFFVIILLLIKNKKSKVKWNYIFSKICYFVNAIIIFILFLLMSLPFFPLAFIKSLIHSAYDNSSKFKSSMLLKILLEIIIRPAKLFYYLLEDSVSYWKLLYKNDEEVKEDKKSLINQKVIIKLRKALIYFRYIKKKKFINLDDLYSKLGITKKIRIRNLEKSVSPHSLEASVSDINANSNTKQAVDSPKSQLNSTNSNLPSLHSNIISNDSSLYENKTNSTEEINRGLKYLMNKIVDLDNVIDIDRTLTILPQRVKYNCDFIESLNHLNMRRLLRGLRTYFYLKTSQNPTYTFQKIQKVVKKILLKFKLIYNYLPESVMKELAKEKFAEINNNGKYQKTLENLNRLAENDEFSDFEEESKNYLISIQANLMSLKNHIEHKANTVNSNERNIIHNK